MYEHHVQRLISRRAFVQRMLRHGGYAAVIVAISLLIGMSGYRLFDGLSWTDAFVNAAMLLGGMGPVDTLRNSAAKVFAGAFALYAGLVFVAVTSLMLAPVFHRVLHAFHAELQK